MSETERQKIVRTLKSLYDLEVSAFVYGGRGYSPYASRDALTKFNAQLKRAEQLEPTIADFEFSIPDKGSNVVTPHAELLNALKMALETLAPDTIPQLRDYEQERRRSYAEEGRFAEGLDRDDSVDDILRLEEYFRDPRIGENLLRVGDSGVASRNIRHALRSLGYEIAPGDLYDEELELRVISFQKEYGHNVVDGQIGPGTRRRLTRAVLAKLGPSFFARLEPPQRPSSPRVFLSYAWEDGKIVDKLDQWLRDQDIRVWRDSREFVPGKQIPDLIKTAIREADKVVAVYSRRSKGRDWPAFEIKIAEELERDGKEVLIYLVLDDTPLPSHDPLRLAVMGNGRTLKEVGQDLLHGILGWRREVQRIEYDENEVIG